MGRRRPLVGRVMIAAAIAAVALMASPSGASAASATVGMPFAGKWAYNVNVNPPYTDVNSSHPSVHTKYYGDWATDLYASAGTPVRLRVSSSGSLSFGWLSFSDGNCGQRTVVSVYVDGGLVGSIYFEHLANAVKGGAAPTNGMIVGYVGNFGCNPGPHVHFELKGNSCWTDRGHPGVTLADGTAIGALGAGSGAARQQCAATQPPAGPAAGTDNNGSRIVSVASGRCLDVAGAGVANGAGLQIWDCLDNAQQHWRYDDGMIRVYGNHNKCLDADAANGGNGTRVQIWDCTGAANQKWAASANGSLISAASGRCLDVNGAGTANGASLQLWDCSGADWQRWRGLPNPNGGGAIKSAASGRCLDVEASSISPGASPQIWDCSGASQQQWILDGGQLRVYGDKCLDAAGGGTENGTPVQIWYCNGFPQQQWEWRADGTIRSIPGGRCLDVRDSGTANGAKLQLWDCSGAEWQRWLGRPGADPQPPSDPGQPTRKCRRARAQLKKARRKLAVAQASGSAPRLRHARARVHAAKRKVHKNC